MLSSHHGKVVSSVPTSTPCENSQQYYNTECNEIRICNTDTFTSKLTKNDMMNTKDINSPKKMKNINKDLFISTDLQLTINSSSEGILVNSPCSSAIHSSPLSQLQQSRISRSTGIDNAQYDIPPANCKMPLNLTRRSSLALMSPPLSAGLVKSATSNAFLSGNDQLSTETSRSISSTPNQSNLGSPMPRAQQLRNSSIMEVTRRHSVPNNVHLSIGSVNTQNISSTQRLAMGNGAFGSLEVNVNDSYLPTPTEPTFRNSFGGETAHFMDSTSSIPPFLPTHSSDPHFSSGVHPFDVVPTVGTADTWASGKLSGAPLMPLPMSTATKSATIQYLQQLQQTMLQHPDPQSTQQSQQHDALSALAKQQKASLSGQGSQSRRGSKTKVKRRVGSLPTPPGQSYMSAELPWSTLSNHTQLMAVQSVLPSHQCNSVEALSLVTKQSVPPPPPAPVPAPTSAPARPYYHGPAPCGNPEPLYEYLASPTIVPGLEIIGHDYYGNYVQILPICPETTCSMNQDPVYLNLLQAIYAHTIPFLDLAPGSEEETQRLMNGTPSAIATQSIQPPFKHLIPLNSNEAQNHNGPRSNGQSSMTTSVSLPTFQQTSNSNNHKLLRKSSVASIDSPIVSNSRRSSIVSTTGLNNPARKKKNAPRTHPYKSTSAFKEDNPMVTEAILTQVGGIGGIGNSTTVSATDPRHKVNEKMVHMDEAEYAAHYSKHQQSISKSASSSSMCLAQTLATSMSGSSLGSLNPSSLMSSSVSSTSMTNATVSGASSSFISPLESIAAADFIKALSECSVSINDHGLNSSEPTSNATPDMDFSNDDLVSLQNLMMMDGPTTAAVQAAASTAWPNWFDLNQLEKDVCQEGALQQAPKFSSTACSTNSLAISNSDSLTSFSSIARDNNSTNLLLSSSADLSIMDDLLDDGQHQDQTSSSNGSQDSEMTLATPLSSNYHHNSTSQILVFDQSENSGMDQSSSSSSASITSLGSKDDGQSFELRRSVSNDLSIPYSSSLLTVLPFSAEHSHPIFPTRGNRRSGWYRSKSIASQGLTEITGVDYTTTCWYNVEQLQNVVRDSISFQESSGLKSLEDLTEPNHSSDN